jgi:hypothetical protein
MARPARNLHIGVQYMGLPGATRECVAAVMRLIHAREDIEAAQIISHANEHALILTVNGGDPVVIKSGFSSGYGGEGPDGLSYVLQLLEFHGVTIEEYAVSAEFLERLDSGVLTVANLRGVDAARPVRPRRWRAYISDRHRKMAEDGTLWTEFPLQVPLALIDARIVDLAKSFWDDPDKILLKAYRRLEDVVRSRTRSRESNTKLFSQAFSGDTPKLVWKNIDASEQVGRANLFAGAYMAYRNPRAHREAAGGPAHQLSEFLLLNQLFCLERHAEKARARAKSIRKR